MYNIYNTYNYCYYYNSCQTPATELHGTAALVNILLAATSPKPAHLFKVKNVIFERQNIT